MDYVPLLRRILAGDDLSSSDMAGLIGASNSPLSGVGICVVVGAALLLTLVVKPLLPPTAGPALVAFALFVTAVIFAAATISNDNLQDLKTGQLVDATPWRQQVALLRGERLGRLIGRSTTGRQ